MDRPGPDYAAAMAFAQQQQAAAANVHPPPQQPQFGFHPPPPHQHQHQQYPAGGGHGSFLPPHPSHQQQFPYGRPPVQQPQYPHPPHMLHMQQQQQQQRPPPAFQQHIPPPLGPPPFHSPYDSSAPSPPPPPPSDPELQKRIDKLVEYAAKNGPEFEAMIREKQKDNPDYAFLFGGDGYNYYRDKLWMATRPPPAGGHFNPPPYPAQSMPIMHPLNPIMGPNAPPQLGGSPNPAASSGMVGAPHLHQGPFPPFYEQNHPQHPMFGGHIRPDYDQTYRPFRGLSRPLPADVEMELNNVLTGLTGTKESIKGAKNWFMQRSPFIPALAEALRDRIFALDDSERQLHIVYLANDILFDSLQRRVNPHELDNEALAFKPVLGSMLARIYHNPQNKEENQSRLQKIVQFWASKEVYDPNTIRAFENEMMGGMHMNPYPGGQRDLSSLSPDPSASAGLANQGANQTSWHLNKQQAAFPSLPEQEYQDKQVPPMQQPPLLPPHQFLPVSVPSSGFVGSAAMMLPSMQQPTNLAAPGSHTLPTSSVGGAGEKLPPYPLFPPGLIPGMVRKMQIGSGVPYSPMSPLDIPTVIPPSNVSPSEILERVSKFFKEIGEVNPSEGPMKPCESSGGGDDYDDYEREPSVRKGGACIPPPPNLLIDPESGGTHHPDERKPPGGSTSSDSGGGHRLGLGAASSANNPNEISQYDDVYSSYRKQRSTNYHTCMSARSAATTTTSIK